MEKENSTKCCICFKQADIAQKILWTDNSDGQMFYTYICAECFSKVKKSKMTVNVPSRELLKDEQVEIEIIEGK